jgi:hypothetical protein
VSANAGVNETHAMVVEQRLEIRHLALVDGALR